MMHGDTVQVLTRMIAYIDEAGDIGSVQDSSRFFLIGYVCMEEEFKWSAGKKVKRAWTAATRTRKMGRKRNEFKFARDTDRVKKMFLNVIKDMDCDLGAFYIEKDLKAGHEYSKIYEQLAIKSIRTIALDHIDDKSHNTITCIIDRRLSKKNSAEFDDRCKQAVGDLLKPNELNIRHQRSEEVKLVQVADYVAGSAWHKLERGNPEFHKIIESKMAHYDLV